MTICAVCKQDVTDIAAHVFVCAGVQAAVKKSQEPKSMEVVDASSSARNDCGVTRVSGSSDPVERVERAQTINQMRQEHPEYFQNWGGNLVEHRTVPANSINRDGIARHSDGGSQPRTDAETVQISHQDGNRKPIEGAELEHALALIKVLHQYVLEHRNDPTQVVGDNGRQFIYKMNYAMLRYGMKTFVSPAQYNWLRGLEKLIHKAMTYLAPSQ